MIDTEIVKAERTFTNQTDTLWLEVRRTLVACKNGLAGFQGDDANRFAKELATVANRLTALEFITSDKTTAAKDLTTYINTFEANAQLTIPCPSYKSLVTETTYKAWCGV